MRQHDRHNPEGRQVSSQIPVAGSWRQLGFSKGTAGASQVVAASHHNSSLARRSSRFGALPLVAVGALAVGAVGWFVGAVTVGAVGWFVGLDWIVGARPAARPRCRRGSRSICIGSGCPGPGRRAPRTRCARSSAAGTSSGNPVLERLFEPALRYTREPTVRQGNVRSKIRISSTTRRCATQWVR
jgi:hypothetical protein